MLRSYRYRLVPTKAQERSLITWIHLTREIYNAGLQERRDAWGKQKVHVSVFDQIKQLPGVRAARPEFEAVPSVVQRGALRRLDRAFAGFFRRCRTGGAPGFPRFKGRDQFSSILIDDLDQKNPIVAGGKRVKIPMLGKVKLHMHRAIEGTPKAMRLTVDAGGRWFVTFACVDVQSRPLPATGRVIGVDLGLTTFAATSDGEMFINPRHERTARIATERAQRRVSRRKRGSKRRHAARVLYAKQRAHVAAVRREHHIQVARSLVSKYDVICVEALNVKGLARSRLAKSVNDAGWGSFLHWLRVKAESAGREVVEVDPRGTSQTCPDCGTVAKKTLAERVHRCSCGLVCDRDVAAARVILGAGLALWGAAPVVVGQRRSAKPKSTAHRSTPRAVGAT